MPRVSSPQAGPPRESAKTYDLWAAAFADRPIVARVARQQARRARAFANSRVLLPVPAIRRAIATAVRPRERRDGTRPARRGGDSGDSDPHEPEPADAGDDSVRRPPPSPDVHERELEPDEAES